MRVDGGTCSVVVNSGSAIEEGSTNGGVQSNVAVTLSLHAAATPTPHSAVALPRSIVASVRSRR